MPETKKIKVRKNNQINIKEFCDNHGIWYRYITVPIINGEKGDPIDENNKYSIEKIKNDPGDPNNSTHLSLYIKHVKSLYNDIVVYLYVIDIDNIKYKNCQAFVALIKKYNPPYTFSRNKKLPHYYILSDVPEYKCETKIFNEFEADIIKPKLNSWELKESIVHKYTGEIPFIPFNELREFLNLERMNFKDKSIYMPPIPIEKPTDEKLQQTSCNNPNKEEIIALINMLSDKRADDYYDWLNVGILLYNLDKEYLDIWIEFSKRCPNKFDEQKCIQKWNSFNKEHSTKLTIASLHYWLKQDNPEKYAKFREKDIINVINYHLNDSDDDLAYVFYRLEKNTFICGQEQPVKIWYQYCNGVWKELDGNSAIRSSVTKNLIPTYKKQLNYYNVLSQIE